MRPCHRLPKEVVDSPPLEVFNTWLDGAWSSWSSGRCGVEPDDLIASQTVLWFYDLLSHLIIRKQKQPASGEKKHAGFKIYLKYSGFFFIFVRKKEDSSPPCSSKTQFSTIPWPQSQHKTCRYVSRLCTVPSQCVLKTLAASLLLWLSCVCESQVHTRARALFPGMGSHQVQMDGLGVGGYEEERRFGCS